MQKIQRSYVMVCIVVLQLLWLLTMKLDAANTVQIDNNTGRSFVQQPDPLTISSFPMHTPITPTADDNHLFDQLLEASSKKERCGALIRAGLACYGFYQLLQGAYIVGPSLVASSFMWGAGSSYSIAVQAGLTKTMLAQKHLQALPRKISLARLNSELCNFHWRLKSVEQVVNIVLDNDCTPYGTLPVGVGCLTGLALSIVDKCTQAFMPKVVVGSLCAAASYALFRYEFNYFLKRCYNQINDLEGDLANIAPIDRPT